MAVRTGNCGLHRSGINNNGWANHLYTIDNNARKGKRDQANVTFSSQGMLRDLVVYPLRAQVLSIHATWARATKLGRSVW